jgi:hypothetical protein
LFEEEVPPDNWDKAIIIPIFKTENYKDCGSCRGISEFGM